MDFGDIAECADLRAQLALPLMFPTYVLATVMQEHSMREDYVSPIAQSTMLTPTLAFAQLPALLADIRSPFPTLALSSAPQTHTVTPPLPARPTARP